MPTRAGWTAAVAGACFIVAGRVVGLIELFGMGAAVLAALAVSLISVRRPLGRLSVTRTVDPSEVECGDTARATVTVTNRGRLRTPWLRLWEPVGRDAGAPMRMAPLRTGAHGDATYRIPTDRRGVIELGPLRVERTDHFGLVTSGSFIGESHETLVFPRRCTIPFPRLESVGPIGQQLRLRSFATSGNEFHSQREYVPGDDLRRINWKASARTSELIVREIAREGVTHCTIALDLDERSYADDAFELAVSMAASVTAASAHASVPLRTVAHGTDLHGPDSPARTMRWLALAAPLAAPSHLDLGAHGDGLSLLVIIGGSNSTEFIASVRHSAGPDDIVVTLQADESDIAELEQFASLWSKLVDG